MSRSIERRARWPELETSAVVRHSLDMTYAGKWARGVYVAALAFTLGRLLLAYDALPEPMASHFNASGRPDGYESKATFVAVMVLLQGLLPLATSIGVHTMPHRLINVPYREYWFAPERRAASLARLRTLLDVLSVGVALVLAFLVELTVRANLTRGPMPVSPMVALALLGLLVVGWLVSALRAFPAPPPA